MARSLDANIVTELSAQVVVPVWFVSLEFDGGDVDLHSDIGDITTTTPAKTWTGTGDLGSIGQVEETTELAAAPLKMSLSGIDATILAEALSGDYWERTCNVYMSFRNLVTGALVADPHGPWVYFISEMEVSPHHINLTAENELAMWDRANNNYYTNTNQQRRFAGDLFCEFGPRMRDLTLRIGPNTVQTGGVVRDGDIDDYESRYRY